MQLTCIKCGHVNQQGSGAADEACPRCHVIYAKARPAPTPRARPEARSSGFAASTQTMGNGGDGGDDADYMRLLRMESQYPAFRAVAGVMAFFGYAVAAVVLVSGVVAWWKFGSVGGGIGGLAVGCLIAVLSKAAKEASLMLADMSDATLRMAQRQERGE